MTQSDSDVPAQEGGLDRRSLIKRGAVVGGALVWTAPLVQTIASPAFATGTDGGGGGEDAVCEDGAAFAFKNDAEDGAETDTNGPCEDPAAEALTGGGNNALNVTSTGDIVRSVTYQEGSGTILSTVTITLAPGYELASIRTKSGDESGVTCPDSILNPTASSGSTTGGFTYVIPGSGSQGISHVTGTIVCA